MKAYVMSSNRKLTELGCKEVPWLWPVCGDNPMLKEELELAAQVMGQDDELLSERLYARLEDCCGIGAMYGQRKEKEKKVPLGKWLEKSSV